MKVAVIGAGNVGGTLAQRIVEADLCDVVLVDIASGMARAKALDLADAKSLTSNTAKVEGTGDYKKICASDIVVVTAGFPRQPGMTREDLLKKNVSITRQVVKEVAKYARDCILIMVTNPLDILTYVALKESNFNPKKVIGMGGVLDSSRFSNLIAQELNVAAESVKTLVIGAHGEAMMPLLRYCTVNGIGVLELLSREKLDLIVENTIKRGAEIVSLLGKGSAYYAPSAAVFLMVKAILKNEQKIVPACAWLSGEYNLKDICIGVPVKLGRNGIEEIIQVKLNPKEQKQLSNYAQSVKDTFSRLKK